MQKSKFKSYIFVVIQFLCLGLILILSSSTKFNSICLVLFIVGTLIGIWAIWTIRIGNFNIVPDIKEDSKLVTNGPYRFIRHPMYTALLLASLGLVLNNLSIGRGLLWIILLIDLLFKLKYEEDILSNHFIEYPVYKSQTKQLIPFIF